MITCGFPEPLVLAALLIRQCQERSVKKLLRPLALIVLCHVIGFAFSAIQLFALIDYFNVSDAWALREGFVSA
jgi:hypothetical protein